MRSLLTFFFVLLLIFDGVCSGPGGSSPMGIYGGGPSGEGTEMDSISTSSSSSQGLPLFMTELSQESNRELALELQATDSYDEVLDLCERIPAIGDSPDRAMRITYADRDDALLCALAVQRLSLISLKYADIRVSQGAVQVWDGLENDRRFEQLTECVDLKKHELSIRDLSRYLRGLMALPFEQESLVRNTMEELSMRLASADLEEIAAILWAVAAARESYGWANHTLTSELITVISESPDLAHQLSKRLLMRLVWALDVLGKTLEKDPLRFYATFLDRIFEEEKRYDISVPECVVILTAFDWGSIMRPEYLEAMAEKVFLDLQTEVIGFSLYGSIGEALLLALNRLGELMESEELLAGRDFNRGLALLTQCSNALFEKSSKYIELLSPYALSQILRLSVSMEMNNAMAITLWKLSAKHLTGTLMRNETVAPMDAADLLEVIAQKCMLDRCLVQARRRAADDTHSTKLTTVSSQSSTLLLYPGWNRIVGRLGTTCALHSEALSRQNLISACWAVSVFGHPFRSLLRAVRKSVQFSLHELSPSSLGQLAISVAAEETVTTGGSRLSSIGAKLDRDFVDQVALSALRTIENVSPIEIQIDTIVAIAQLERITGTSSGDDMTFQRKHLDISAEMVRALDTSTLVKFHWACGRLPSSIASPEAMEMMQEEIQTRLPDSSEVSDCMIFLRSLGDTYMDTKNSAILERAKFSCKLLADRWATEPPGQWDHDKGYSTVSRTAGALCESLQHFIDLKWFDGNFHTVCTSFLRNMTHADSTEKLKMKTRTKCYEEFNIGRLEELSAVYKSFIENADSERPTAGGKRIFSQFLHNIKLPNRHKKS